MALLSLNYDVLSAIVEQTDSGSALKLSMASRGAYALGIAQALASVTLSRSQLQLSAFCNYILAEPSRITHLRELTIESPAFGVARHIEFQRTADFSAAAELADVLERAHRLQHLSIACFEGLIASEPRIGDAICALPDLVEISLHNCGRLAMGVLSRLRSPLRKVKFTALFNRKLPTFFHRLQSLDRLETLELAHLDLSDGSQPHGEVHELPHMPSLRSLSLRGSTARMSLFVRAMPNLQRLRLADVFSKAQGGPGGQKKECWARLAYLKGNVPDLQQWDSTSFAAQRPPFVFAGGDKDEGKIRKLSWWLDHIPYLLRTLSIASIFISVRYTQRPGEEDSEPADVRSDSTCRTIRERVAVAIPALKYVAVAIATRGEDPFDEQQKALAWWQITRVSGMTSLNVVPYEKSASLRDHLVNMNY
ncbi:uncharacterized protein B0H18DRAFT_1125067 [Fomitopsis serialis]|uniref:uncharacterized protein n=1 Tax=Fomitopsis serialis TaxID=139415 RepID=UPI002007CF86|nr:uncharacterized protein B0H18DRAFT_1125067 [Neoantrodia serialis]KAH9915102.1 hypothetical protein B0H18DRAFT_1125067 [Neoantrodia serialis]